MIILAMMIHDCPGETIGIGNCASNPFRVCECVRGDRINLIHRVHYHSTMPYWNTTIAFSSDRASSVRAADEIGRGERWERGYELGTIDDLELRLRVLR